MDIRAGWFNYLFVGTELHRFHHSASLTESKNYALTLSFIDIIFGTFYYNGLDNTDETTGAARVALCPEIVREFQIINNALSAPRKIRFSLDFEF